MDKFLKPVDTRIQLTKENQYLDLNELIIFPHGMDGLHIWEAGIILARFVIQNKEIFDQKKVLELGSGIGIGGLTAAKYTNLELIHLTDYVTDVIKNINKNIVKNSLKHKHKSLIDNTQIVQGHCCSCVQNRCTVLNLDWDDYKNMTQKYDYILGSDLIYSGTPLLSLANLIAKSLTLHGKAFIIIPSERFCTQKFLDMMNELKCFSHSKEKLDGEGYRFSPLKDEKEGFKTYSGLKELDFYVHIFEKTTEENTNVDF